MREFRKVKRKDGKTEIHWTAKVEDTGDETKSELTSSEDPEPEFLTVFGALRQDVMWLLELPAGYEQGLTVTGLSLSYDDMGRMGATITALKELKEANAPLVLNTPYLPEPDGEDPNPQMPGDMLSRVLAVIDHAERFIDGKRAQQDLFEEQGGAASEPELVGAGAE